MAHDPILETITRLSRLLQSHDRGSQPGLQPVQLHALQYLSHCNRYSDRPAVVAEFLGITKGTASQTLRILLEAGLISKEPDPADKRVVRLRLTAAGRRTARSAKSAKQFGHALDTLAAAERDQLASSLLSLLRELQRRNGGRSFGVCKTCRHFERDGRSKFRCGLTQESLGRQEIVLICREHEGVAPSTDSAARGG